MKPLTIVFAGTPAFALPCLEALAHSHHTLKAVYTQPDRPAGRGRQLQASPVKTWALTHHVPVFQPDNFKDQVTKDELAELKPDVMVVIAYGLILPRSVLSIPVQGCINVHASLLPRWRGASPIQHALLHGDEETGVTIMQMDAGMDTGEILRKEACPIYKNETAASLHDRLAQLAVSPLLTTLDRMTEGHALSEPQANDRATYAPKINKEDALIDWMQPAVVIDQRIRAFSPWPIAFTHIDGTPLRIHQSKPLPEPHAKLPGTILAIDKSGIKVATGEGTLLIECLQFPGGRAMPVSDWLNAGSRQLQNGCILQ